MIENIDKRINTNTTLESVYNKIYIKTCEHSKLKEDVDFINCFFEEWVGNFLHPFGNDLNRGNELDNSMFYCYLVSQSTVFDWLTHSLLCGAYEVVLRELRCILEGMVTSYFLDIHFPKLDLNEKIKKLRDNKKIIGKNGKELSVYKIFELSDFHDWKKYYNDCYGELCNYIHMSTKANGTKIHQIVKQGYGDVLEFSFNSNIFQKSVKMWKKIAILSSDLAGNLLDCLNIEIVQTNPNYFND